MFCELVFPEQLTRIARVDLTECRQVAESLVVGVAKHIGVAHKEWLDFCVPGPDDFTRGFQELQNRNDEVGPSVGKTQVIFSGYHANKPMCHRAL